VVAPPEARLYVSVSEVLYFEISVSIQFCLLPLAVVQPGNVGLPRGLEAEGLEPLISKPVCE
jgi:hypothetical protein